MAGLFDDLIPQQPQPSGGDPANLFADLIPNQQPGFAEGIGRAFATGVPILGGLANKLDAATNAALAPYVEPLLPASWNTHPLPEKTFGERYAHSLALQEGRDASFANAHPVINTASELAGGVAATIPAASTSLGARLLGLTGSTFPRQIAQGALSGAGLNAIDAVTRGNDPVEAAVVGGTIGGVLPGAVKAAGTVMSPLVSNVMARVNPARYAEGQVARAFGESGLSPQQVSDAVIAATREGQPEFAVADALGNPGQRMLSTVARAPGEGRTDVVNFLDARQAGQGRRVANTLAEGFNAPETAAQTEARLTGERGTAADVNYAAARANAGAVNVTPAIRQLDVTLQPGMIRALSPQTNIADDSVEGLLRRARQLLTDGHSQISDFDAAMRVKQEFDYMIEGARPTAQRLLKPARNALDDALADASEHYAAARNQFRQQSRTIEAVGTGRLAATRGRTENTVPAFNAMGPDQQAAFRSGYADPLIEQTQGAAAGVNKARPFTSDAFQTEAQAFAPDADQMMRRIGRENTMFETRNHATGNSRTVENLADDNSLGNALNLARQIKTGDLTGAVRTTFGALGNALTGSTPAVRQEVGRLLMMRGGNVTPDQLSRILNNAVQRVRANSFRQRLLTAAMGRSAASQATPQAANQ